MDLGFSDTSGHRSRSGVFEFTEQSRRCLPGCREQFRFAGVFRQFGFHHSIPVQAFEGLEDLHGSGVNKALLLLVPEEKNRQIKDPNSVVAEEEGILLQAGTVRRRAFLTDHKRAAAAGGGSEIQHLTAGVIVGDGRHGQWD